jgi:hypothetical protein
MSRSFQLSFAVVALLASTLMVHAQASSSETRPAAPQSVTSGIGSSSTTSEVPPGEGRGPLLGPIPPLPEDSSQQPADTEKEGAATTTDSRPAAPKTPAAKAFEERNTIAPDRYQSPHDQ